ncbi:pyridoxamine 5'-phosphate oxidase family protein [Sphingomonas sp.]|uniref:pyridoxamine 5'-phosphate oxidase family protein n=1 Tax=Sphingomonas sp. TaxID=28214 RepID=UPI00286EA4E8|nr:pyridoxamine 5'-phosphate oxidase family protein [Sphingomonas sp.]
MTSDRETQQRLEKKLWEELEDSRFVMLGLHGVDDDFTRPMTAQVDRPKDADDDQPGKIYFFAAHSEDLVKGLAKSNKAIATFAAKDHKLFASIHGKLVLDQDRAVIERLWNPIIASWYKDGKDDPDLALIRFDADKADVWEAATGATLKAAALKMLFNIDPGKEHQDEHRAEVAL